VPTFDYEYPTSTASDATHMIQVESKGTVVDDSSIISDPIRRRKALIDAKKEKIRLREQAGSYPHPAGLRYGVICALGRTGPLHCWLTDPPPMEGADPRKFRLLARLQYIRDWISFLSKRSQLAASLATRLRALHALADPFVLANVPLLRDDNEPYEIPPFDSMGRRSGLPGTLCQVTDGPAVGTLLRLTRGELLFLGVQRKLYEMAAEQNFAEILSYRETHGSVEKRVHCVLPRGRAQRMHLERLHETSRGPSAYVRFAATGVLHYSPGGAVFGVVAPERQQPSAVSLPIK
jgi:hypothetical protein